MYIVQPDNTTLKDYGRLLKDGELKIRAHSDNRTKTRSVLILHVSYKNKVCSGLVEECWTHNCEVFMVSL